MSKLTTVLQSRFVEARTAINSKYQISAYLDSKGIRTQSNRQIKCPFHDDSTPSFSVNFEENVWKCFGCQNGGHFVDIWKTYANKYENGNYNIYTAVDAILSSDNELQVALGFKSIFKSDDDVFDLFEQKDEHYQIDDLLTKRITVRTVITDSMLHVLGKLRDATPDKLVQFVSDCQMGMSEAKLISKYFRGQCDTEAYVVTLAETSQKNQAELTAAFLEALS